MSWVPLHAHDGYSLLDGYGNSEMMVDRLVECGYKAAAQTNHGNVAGIPSFFRECKKKGLKGISGCEFYLCGLPSTHKTKENRQLSHLCVLAKNKQGWKNLLRAVSASNQPSSFYYKPRLSLDELASFSGGHFICFSGHMGSDCANALFGEPKLAYRATSEAEAISLLRSDWESHTTALMERYGALFGRENFFVEIQKIDRDNLPASEVVAERLRYLARKKGFPCVATADSHYPRPEDAPDQRLLLVTNLRTTFKKVWRALDAGEDVGLSAFFKSNRYCIPTLEEMQALHTPDELANSVRIADMCESYDIFSSPLLPVFPCPSGQNPDEYMRELCQQGWKRKIAGKIDETKLSRYAERAKHELSVLQGANLSSYFLIVNDYVNAARGQFGAITGERGSAAGCLSSYLLGITDIDPVRHGLTFERFYSEGRNTPGNISLPDIDIDFPIACVQKVYEYLRAKYGHDRVAWMASFGTMKGRAALKDVLRAHDRVSAVEMNRITEPIPNDSAISDDLQEMADAGEEPSIIRWALENRPGKLKEWCRLTPDGELEGPLAVDFAQAIRLEGTKRSLSRHPCGVVVCSHPIEEVAPWVLDSGGKTLMAGFSMKDAEAVGLVKFDILSSASLDKLMTAQKIIRTGTL